MKKSMLLTTIAMIVVVVIALSTATFAWFTAAGQSAVEGTLTVQAGAEFTLKVSDGQVAPQWVDAGGTINIADGLTGIAPISPTVQINGDNTKYSSIVSDTNTVPTQDKENGHWYSVKGSAGGYSGLEDVTSQATKTYAYTAMQVTRNDGQLDAHVRINISVPDGAANVQALQGARVLMAITSFDMSSGAATTTEWFGTQYTYGGEGLVTPEGGVVALEPDTWKTASGKGTDATGLTSLTKGGTFNTLGEPVSTYAEGIKNWNVADVFRCAQNAKGEAMPSIHRFLEKKITFSDSIEPKTIQVWVWMDGHKVTDASSQKNVSVTISFAKDAATA